MQRILARHGILAIDPRVLASLYAAQPAATSKPDRSNIARGDAVIVRVHGPLDNHRSEECDSYEEIISRVTDACASSARTVVLSFDSPGGAVAGCFEAAQVIKARCAAAGKTLISYVEGRACSAAYALACAGSRIVAPPSAIVGSIGIIEPRIDMTRADQAMGVSFSFVTSGARKADGNPHVAFSVEELRDKQRVIDALAGVFFASVSEARGLSTTGIAALEAREFTGFTAKELGLVDDVQTLDELLASAGAEVGMSAYERALSALREAAEGDGDEAAAARRALSAMDGDEGDKPEGDDEKKDDGESAESEAPEESAESEEPDGDEASPAGESAAAASASASVSAATAGELAATVQRLERKVAELSRGNEVAERRALFASRQLTPQLRKHLESKPLAEVKLILSALPKVPGNKLAASATPASTRGEGRGTGERAESSDPELARIDSIMGMGRGAMAGSTFKDNVLTLGVAPLAKKGG